MSNLYAGTFLSQTSPLLPPKGTDPGTLRIFPCKGSVFKGPPEGAIIAIVGPWQADAGWWARGPAPKLEASSDLESGIGAPVSRRLRAKTAAGHFLLAEKRELSREELPL